MRAEFAKFPTRVAVAPQGVVSGPHSVFIVVNNAAQRFPAARRAIATEQYSRKEK